MLASGIALLLVSAAVGYWVLERANSQKKNLKLVGQIVGSIIIIVSFLGVTCKIYYLSTGKAGYYGKAFCSSGSNCPFMKAAPSKTK